MPKDILSEEDKALFRASMREVKPLNKKTNQLKHPVISESKPVQPIVSAKAGRLSEGTGDHSDKPVRKNYRQSSPKQYFLSDYISNSVHSETILSWSIPGLPLNRLRSLKRGEIPRESRLDLHGLTTEAARDALCRFIQIQFQNNKRCVLIIHGKGGHQGEAPLIKNLVNRWLPQFDEIAAYHSALGRDGGAGAVYVLLKKWK